MDFVKELLSRTFVVLSSIICFGIFMFISLLLIIYNVWIGVIFTFVVLSIFIAYMDLKK